MVFLFSGCNLYYDFDNDQKYLISKENISEENMCNMISQNKNAWISDKRKCAKKITDSDVNSLIFFNKNCNSIEGKVEITSENTVCSLYNLNIVYKNENNGNLNNFFDKIRQLQYSLRLEADKYNTIKELCPTFEGSIYNEDSRSCKFKSDREIPYEYFYLEKIIRKKDNLSYKNEQIEKADIKTWENEAKNWKGTLDDLCENLTDSKNNFDKQTLSCKTYWKKEIKKYEVMKPFLIDQHHKITAERDKILLQKVQEEREKEIQIKNEWEKRIGKSQEIINVKDFIFGHKSFTCESYKSFLFFFPKKIRLDVGVSTIQINNSFLVNYIDSYKDYFLYQGYDKNDKVINLKVYKQSLLKTTPYSLDIEGLGYYCELLKEVK